MSGSYSPGNGVRETKVLKGLLLPPNALGNLHGARCTRPTLNRQGRESLSWTKNGWKLESRQTPDVGRIPLTMRGLLFISLLVASSHAAALVGLALSLVTWTTRGAAHVECGLCRLSLLGDSHAVDPP